LCLSCQPSSSFLSLQNFFLFPLPFQFRSVEFALSFQIKLINSNF
jgi:hypothetical protein